MKSFRSSDQTNTSGKRLSINTVMATVGSTDSSAPPGQTGDSSGPQQSLLNDIKDTKGELVDVKKEIKDLNKRLDDGDFTATGRFSSVEKVEDELKHLKHKEKQLNDRLNTLYETQKLTAQQQQQQQQQQSGAGASMLLAL